MYTEPGHHSDTGFFSKLRPIADQAPEYALRRLLSTAVALGSLTSVVACQTSVDSVQVSSTVLPSVDTYFSTSNDPNRLGRFHLAASNYAMAERHFKEAVEKNNQDADSWMGLAVAYDNLGRYDLADRAYGQAAALGGETLELINNLGYSYLLRGDGSRALTQFERALAIEPDNTVVINNLRLLRLGQRPVRSTPL